MGMEINYELLEEILDENTKLILTDEDRIEEAYQQRKIASRKRREAKAEKDRINLAKREKELEELKKEVVDNNVVQEQKRIDIKKIISTKEFKDKYTVSISSQADYRGRINDPLPYKQKVDKGKITYIVEEVDNWLENQ